MQGVLRHLSLHQEVVLSLIQYQRFSHHEELCPEYLLSLLSIAQTNENLRMRGYRASGFVQFIFSEV